MSATAFEPFNPLEVALVNAASEPAARPQFYRELLDSQVLIVPTRECMAALNIVDGVIQKGAGLALASIESEGKQYVPFFSSERRLPIGTRFLQMPCRSFFELTQGASLLLNPGAAYGKELLPNEVSGLLDGSLFRPLDERIVQRDTPVLIGRPKEYPVELERSLQRLYSEMPQVSRAYLAFYHDSAKEAEGGLLLAIEADESCDFRRISAESGIVIQSVPKAQKYADVIRYRRGEQGIGEYFAKQSPFYRRNAFGGFWRRIRETMG